MVFQTAFGHRFNLGHAQSFINVRPEPIETFVNDDRKRAGIGGRLILSEGLPMKAFFLAAASVLAVVAAPVSAAPILTELNANLLTAPATISFQGASFILGAVSNPFAPLTVQTAGSGAVSAFGGFLGIPITPTTFFTDRGTVTFGPNSGSFASFDQTTSVPSSNGRNFLGLRATIGADNFYGFAFTQDNILRGFGFETSANTTITATTSLSAAVPEPATWGVMLLGFAIVGTGMRSRRRRTTITYA